MIPSDRSHRHVLNVPVSGEFKDLIFAEAARQGTNAAAWIRRLCQDELLRVQYARRDQAQARYAEAVRRQMQENANAILAENLRRKMAEAQKSREETWGSRSIGSRL
jgi:hypothetical protein